MISHAEYQKIQELKEIGLSQAKISKYLNLSRGIIERWWHLTEAEYFNAERSDKYSLENYREYIISILKLCPQISATNVYYKLTERFEEFAPKRSSFYRYLKSLREQLGYEKKRLTVARESLPPGHESQIDFGQFRMMSMYGNYVRIYFFTMVLSYSNMRFVYFSPDPFTTETAIKAHEYAYRYFGGRTKVNLYDQDKVFVVNENMGNIMFVKEFEDYAKETGFSITLCRPRDPQTKGRVENLVGYIKQGFLEGRTYEGVDSLNRAALNWLDREANEHQLKMSNYSPRELFIEESKHLLAVKPSIFIQKTIYAVTDKNSICYKQNEYALPKDKVKTADKVRIEVFNDTLIIYRLSDSEFLCKHKINNDIGKVASCEQSVQPTASDEKIRQAFQGNIMIEDFFTKLKSKNPRYFLTQCSKIIVMQKHYSADAILDGITYCIRADNADVGELLSYMIYKHGSTLAKRFANKTLIFTCNKRAKEIEEEYHGKRN